MNLFVVKSTKTALRRCQTGTKTTKMDTFSIFPSSIHCFQNQPWQNLLKLVEQGNKGQINPIERIRTTNKSYPIEQMNGEIQVKINFYSYLTKESAGSIRRFKHCKYQLIHQSFQLFKRQKVIVLGGKNLQSSRKIASNPHSKNTLSVLLNRFNQKTLNLKPKSRLTSNVPQNSTSNGGQAD